MEVVISKGTYNELASEMMYEVGMPAKLTPTAYLQGAKGDRGPEGPAGEGLQGIQGLIGLHGHIGLQGPAGPTTSITVLGSLDSTDDLPKSGNKLNDSYIINQDLWVFDDNKLWNETHKNGFVNTGKVQGPQGIQGPIGEGKAIQVIAGDNIDVEADYPNDKFTISANVPVASTTTPNMAGNASAGSEDSWAHGDHVHPHDTTKQDVIEDLQEIRNNASDGAEVKENYIKSGEPSWESSVPDFDSFADTVHNTPQVLSEAQKQQVRSNIDAQASLNSGVNIKTINGESITGSGNLNTNLSGSTKPTNPYIGMSFYDTTINKPIWWSGSDWRLSDGTVIN